MLHQPVLRLFSRNGCHSSSCRTIFWWGHDTTKDQEKRLRAIEDKKLIKWEPKNEVAVVKETFYAPSRILAEETALSTGFSWERFNLTDWYGVTTFPYFAWANEPLYYANYKKIKNYKKMIESQRFDRERLLALGPDLSAAYFLIARGCSVRFKGQTKWVEGMYSTTLPNSYEPGYNIEAIDASDSVLIYEGFSNLRNLIYLKHLDISYSPNINAWCMDRITGEYANSLEYLDISGCRNLNWNGIECIWRLFRLKTLVMRDMDHIKDINMLCLMLLDIFPNLEIRGVDYIDTSLLRGTPEEYLLDDSDLFLLSDGATEAPPKQEIKSES